jgi:hypothetical protein
MRCDGAMRIGKHTKRLLKINFAVFLQPPLASETLFYSAVQALRDAPRFRDSGQTSRQRLDLHDHDGMLADGALCCAAPQVGRIVARYDDASAPFRTPISSWASVTHMALCYAVPQFGRIVMRYDDAIRANEHTKRALEMVRSLAAGRGPFSKENSGVHRVHYEDE